MEILKALLFNGTSMLLALLVAFFILYLLGKAKKKGGCGCASCNGGGAQPQVAPVGGIMDYADLLNLE